MSRLFFNVILKTLQYLHMKVCNERISKRAQLFFWHKQFPKDMLKLEKELVFLVRYFPL